MKRPLYIFIMILIAFTVSGCTPDNTNPNPNDDDTPTKEYGENTIALHNRITNLYENHNDMDIVIESNMAATLTTGGVPQTYYTYDQTETYMVDELYYYAHYIDNANNEIQLQLYTTDTTNIKKETVNDILFLSEWLGTQEGYFNDVGNPLEYFNLFFTTIDYTKISDNRYQLTIPFDTFVSDPATSDIFEELNYNQFYTDLSDVDLSYVFTDHTLSMTMDITLLLEAGSEDTVEINYEASLSFADSIDQVEIYHQNYYVNTSRTITDVMPVYELGDNLNMYFNSNMNVIKLELDPGFYFAYISGGGLEVTHVENDSKEQFDTRPVFVVPEHGYYYLYVDAHSPDYGTVTLTQVPESQLGTPDNPLYESSTFTGSYNGEDWVYHMLDVPTTGAVVKMTATVVDGRRVQFAHDWESLVLTAGNSLYFGIAEGDLPIIRVAGQYPVNYELTYEVVPYTPNTTNLNDMPILEVCNWFECDTTVGDDPNVFLGGDHLQTHLRFDVTEAGEYVIAWHIVSWDNSDSTFAPVNIYNEQGELMAGLSTVVYLEPGTYYVEANCHEGGYMIVEAWIERADATE